MTPRGLRALACVAAALGPSVQSSSSADTPPPIVWAAATASPAPEDLRQLGDLERTALAKCGVGDANLRAVAHHILAQRLAGGALPAPDAVAFLLRAAGEPHPSPRVWSSMGRGASAVDLLVGLDEWAGPPSSSRRCGVAAAPEVVRAGARISDGLVVVAVEAHADLGPLPTRARVGQWLTVEARLAAPARGGQVFVVGPSGAPRPVWSSSDGASLRARFAPDGPGEHRVQVLADLPTGPRPVLEASVFVGVDPPIAYRPEVAPGEDEGAAPADDGDRLAGMIRAAREQAGRIPLVRDARLDHLALLHSLRMKTRGEVAHDVGDGPPDQRLAAAGLGGHGSGENVAFAADAPAAHRALWASPSHRLNMLSTAFRRFGVAAVRDPRGGLWVTEVFDAP